MFRQKHDLAHMVGIMSDLAVDRLHHGVWLCSNRHPTTQVRVRERLQRVEDVFPAPLPQFQKRGARRWRVFKFRVAVAIRLLAIGGQKIRPARTHVPGHMFYDKGDGVRFCVKLGEQAFIGTLRHSPFAELLVIME